MDFMVAVNEFQLPNAVKVLHLRQSCHRRAQNKRPATSPAESHDVMISAALGQPAA